MTTPAAPTNLRATGGYGIPPYGQNTQGWGSCVVDWDPDPSNPATSFTATASPGGAVVHVLPPMTGVPARPQAIFPSLTINQPYTFTVTATNGSGTSPASDPSPTAAPVLMPGMLTNVLTALRAQMAQDYTTYSLGIGPPEIYIGGEYIAQQSVGPRIVFVPRGGVWKGSLQLGSGVTTVPVVSGVIINQPRQVRDREVQVEARIWGFQQQTGDAQQDSVANYGYVELLMANLAASMWTLMTGCVIDMKENWISENMRNEANGAAAQLSITIKIPTPAYWAPVATILTTPQTMAVVPP